MKRDRLNLESLYVNERARACGGQILSPMRNASIVDTVPFGGYIPQLMIDTSTPLPEMDIQYS